MSSTVDPVDDPIISAITTSDASLLVVVSDAELLAAILEGAFDVDPESVRILTPRTVANEVLADFIVASRTAELVERGTLSIRLAEEVPTMPLIVGEDRVTRFVTIGNSLYTLGTADSGFVTAATEHFDKCWESAEEYPVSAAPISTVRQELEEVFGPGILEDFEAMVDAKQGDGLRIADRFILLAARHRALLYDIGRWGEEMGISSRATFSRAKARLERKGVVATEKVPIEHGRPRQQLLLADDRYRDASMDDLLRIADDLVNDRVRGSRVMAD